MKIGTVPKITVGVAALIALIFIGFIGIRQMNAPTVEERVYLSPWEDGTARRPNSTEGLAAQTESTQDTENRDNPPQIAAAEMEPIDDFLGQSQETNTAQFATEAEFESEEDQNLSANTFTLLDDEGRSPEDVMYAYVEAYKNADFEALFPLVTGVARERAEGALRILSGGLAEELLNEIADNMPEGMSEEMADRVIQMMLEMMQDPETLARTRGMFSQMFGQTEVVSSEYVEDEFHFRLRTMPELPELPEIPQVPGLEIPKMPELPRSMETLVKMRRVDGAWQIYDNNE